MDDIPYLLMRSSVLKGELVGYANDPRFDPQLGPMARQAAAPDGTLEQGKWIQILDDFIMRYRFPDGDTVIDRFLRSHEDLDPVDREMLLRWRDPVDGIFELVRTEDEVSILRHLFDDQEYRVYSNTGRSLADFGDDVAFIGARLAPLTANSWVSSGVLTTYPRGLAQTIMEVFAAANPDDDLKIPKAMRPAAEAIIDVTGRVCAELLDDEYARLARKAVAKLARKRPSPISSGRPATWAGAVVYALGQINFLFDRESKPYATADDLSGAFGVAKSTLGTKAKQVRDALKLDNGSVEFLTETMVDASPVVWLISVDGFFMDARRLSLDDQIKAFVHGAIPYIPALGRDGTAKIARQFHR